VNIPAKFDCEFFLATFEVTV